MHFENFEEEPEFHYKPALSNEDEAEYCHNFYIAVSL